MLTGHANTDLSKAESEGHRACASLGSIAGSQQTVSVKRLRSDSSFNSMKANMGNMSMYRTVSVPIQVYLWTLKFEF